MWWLDRREPLQAAVGQRGDAHLQREVRDDRRQVAVAGALAVAVDRALHVPGAGPHRRPARWPPRSRCRRGRWTPTITSSPKWSTTAPTISSTSWGSEPPLVSHSTRWLGALGHRGLEHRAGRTRGCACSRRRSARRRTARRRPFAGEELDRVGHHGHALVERGQQRLGDVVVPALGDDAHRRRCRPRRGCAGSASSSTLPFGRRVEPKATSVDVSSCSSVRGPLEELVVLGVGAGPAALDAVHAEVVELLGDAQLVVDGERDALELACRRAASCRRSRRRSGPGSCVPQDMFDPVLVAVDLAADRLARTRRRSPWSSGRGTGSPGRRPS